MIFIASLVIYCILSIYPMVLFVHKMYALMKLRASSLRNFTAKQHVLLKATTKYITLLSIALVSSWISVSTVIIANALFGDQEGEDRYTLLYISGGVLVCIDVTFNIICLYLQYPFNKKYYDKYCICFGNCCVYLLTCNTSSVEKDMGEIVEMNNEQMTVPQTPTTPT